MPPSPIPKRLPVPIPRLTFLGAIVTPKSNVPKSWGPSLHQGVRDGDPLSILYTLSPALFAMAGLYQLLYLDELTARVSASWPWILESWILFVQAGLCYASDVHTLGETSVYHMLDRMHAPLLTGWNFLRLMCFVTGHFATVPSFAAMCVQALAHALAFIVFRRAFAARRANDYRGYLTWHSVWHFSLPIGAACLTHSMLGEMPSWLPFQ